MMKRKFIVLFVALLLVFSACSKKSEEVVVEEPKEKTNINFGILNGPTGIGSAYLLERNSNDESENHYEVSVSSDPSEVASQLIASKLDIAALPTNLAASLYNKTNGGIKVLALNTAGVLYILENGSSINSFEDLNGKTIYATGQGANPEYVLNYLLEQNNVEATVEFLDSAELVTRMTTGEIEVSMLPVPAVTTVLMKNENVRIALDLTEQWDKLNNGSMLTMGCVVVRDEFLKENKEAVDLFLKEYEESINYVKENVSEAGSLCEKFAIVPNSAIASKAINDAHLIFVKGNDIKNTINGYYEVLLNANPQSIGGNLPGDDFYIGE